MPRRKAIRGEIINAVLSGSNRRPSVNLKDVSKPTFAQQIASVMRNGRIMNAKQVVEALDAAGIDIHSSSPASYVATTLATAHTMVKGPDGDAVRVPTFTRVESGRYRVSNQEDIRLVVKGSLKSETASDPVSPVVRSKRKATRKQSDAARKKSVEERKAQILNVGIDPDPEKPAPAATANVQDMAPPDKLRSMMRTMMAEHLKPIMEEEIRNTPKLGEMMQSMIAEQIQALVSAEIRKTLQRMLDS